MNALLPRHGIGFGLFFAVVLAGLAGCSAGVSGTKSKAVVSVSVAGASSTRLGATTQFAATVSGSANQAVVWQVNGATGGSTAAGTILAAGLYTETVTKLETGRR